MSDRVPDGQPVAELVSRLGESVFADVEALRIEIEQQLATGAPRRADLAIEEPCLALLTNRDRSAAGAGLVVTPGLLTDAPYWLEWWTSDPTATDPAPRRLAAVTDPRVAGFRDYTSLPWYEVPLRTGRRHVTGPYVDYLCTDQQTLTFTAPVWRGGAFAGVVGIDLLVATVEERAYAVLAQVPRRSVLVNRLGRVITSSDLSLVTGDLVRGLPADPTVADPRWLITECPGLPFLVLTERGPADQLALAATTASKTRPTTA